MTEDDVVKIKKLMIAGNLSTEEMCEMFDVASGTISNISTGITWRRVLVNEFEPNKNGKRKKLSECDVRRIKQMLRDGKHTQEQIAIKFLVSGSTITNIKQGVTHKWIK